MVRYAGKDTDENGIEYDVWEVDQGEELKEFFEDLEGKWTQK